jgi:hypothetical protein
VLQGSATKTNFNRGTATAAIESDAMEASEDGFPEQSRRIRNNSTDNELHQGCRKKATRKITAQPPKKAFPATTGHFAPLRTAEMGAEEERGD